MTTKRYNGWTNYETWCVNLWLDNDRGTSNDKRDIIKNADDKYHAYRALKDYVEEYMIPDLGASFAADMLGAAMSEVDWDEIVESEWDELHDNDKVDDDD